MGGRLLAHEYAHSSFMYMVAYSMGACKDASLKTSLVGSQMIKLFNMYRAVHTFMPCLKRRYTVLVR
eukprot:scaffold201153_cov47-Attheya_sp.AAC.1